jgi:hypothetical protein
LCRRALYSQRSDVIRGVRRNLAELSPEVGVRLMSEYAPSELGALHPTAFSNNGTQFSNFSTVDGDRDDLTSVDAIEQCASVVSELTRRDCGHASSVAPLLRT